MPAGTDTLSARAEEISSWGNKGSSRGNEGSVRGNDDTERGNDAGKGEDDLTGVGNDVVGEEAADSEEGCDERRESHRIHFRREIRLSDHLEPQDILHVVEAGSPLHDPARRE